MINMCTEENVHTFHKMLTNDVKYFIKFQGKGGWHDCATSFMLYQKEQQTKFSSNWNVIMLWMFLVQVLSNYESKLNEKLE